MTHLIIDGYNFLHQDPQSGLGMSLEYARERLLKRLSLYKRVRRHEVTVVFDGRSTYSEFSPSFRQAGVAVRFTPDGITADSEIARLVQREGAKAVVVSSDREVQNSARMAGAVSLSAHEFLSRLNLAECGEIKKVEERESVHKRWMTKKVGPSKKLPKKMRRKAQRTKNL